MRPRHSGPPIAARGHGDWDGDGRTDLGVRDPATGGFTLRSSGGAVTRRPFGTTTDRGVTGDWNGDKVTDLAVYDQGTLTLAVRGATPVTRVVVLGDADDLPVTGGWDGDGDTDLGVWDPATATWTMRVAARRSTGVDTQTTAVFGRAR